MLKASSSESWTLFLDRDGVINKRKMNGYITSVDEFELLPFVVEGLQQLSSCFDKMVIVTNQQGVGKGIMSEKKLNAIHQELIHQFASHSIYLDGIYVATNLAGSHNDRRKPNPALALEAKKKFPMINFNRSLMVGDTDSDLLFGMNLGMKTALILSSEKCTLTPDYKANNLKKLAHEICN